MEKVITKIEAQKRQGRFNIYVNDQYAFPVSEEVLINYRLFKGMEVDGALIEELKKADNISKLYNRALTYLAHNLRTEYEVRTKLAEIVDVPEAIEQVIQKLKDQQLIDDHRYADSYVRTVVNQQKNGPNWIRQRLLQKRVAKPLIEQSLADFFPEESVVDIGIQVAESEIKHRHHDSVKMVLNKTKETLIRRGFSFDVINEIMARADQSALASQDSDLIQKVASKYWRQYKKYEGYQRIQKTKQALFRKGFNMDDIERVMEDLSES